jgi:hypothetical protein
MERLNSAEYKAKLFGGCIEGYNSSYARESN